MACLYSVNPAQQRMVVTLTHCQNKVQLSCAPIYPSILFGSGWARHIQAPHIHTHKRVYICTHVELPTALLIVKMVYQSNGEIKGEKEGCWGWWQRGFECNSQRPSLHRLKCISLLSFCRHREKAIR